MRILRTITTSLLCAAATVLAPLASDAPSIARIWNEEVLSAIRIDLPHPPVHARNLFHLSVAMYDAWAAYDAVAVGYLYHQKSSAGDLQAARDKAISFAAYRILRQRYALSRNATNTLAALDARMAALGYDPLDTSTDPSSPAGLGNRVAEAVFAFAATDGSLQERGYADLPQELGGYVPKNAPLLTMTYGTLAVDPNRWQPLAYTNAVSQNNIPVDLTQKFLGSQWLAVRPFALQRSDTNQPWINPGHPPYLGGEGDAQYRAECVEIIRKSSELTPDDDVTIDISPGSFGNSTLGTNDGKGHSVNPATGQPYKTNLVKRGDFARVLAEFWADGPKSETPPGHWNVIANRVSDIPGFQKRVGGAGRILDDLEWDVKLYFAINAALHDAACAAWSLKRYYDGWRPIEAIRYMGQRGQSSDQSNPTYHPLGLPLVPGLIEIVTVATASAGGRHAGLPIGQIAIWAWPGPPNDSTNHYSSVKWIRADAWLPYQKLTFVTPAFPGYVSGHSTFSRAAAEVMSAFTGSEFFPGGLATFSVPAKTGLTFEQGPSQPVQLQWATYFDAADQAGLSRLWGGIHVSADDLKGRQVGAQCGQSAWALVKQYFDGSIALAPLTLTISHLGNGSCELRADTTRGLTYSLQSALSLGNVFSFTPDASVQATDTVLRWITHAPNSGEFFRLVRQP